MAAKPRNRSPKNADTLLFSPAEGLERALARWWWIVVGVLVGGLAGLLVWALQPPVYEAGFAIPTTIDFTNTGELTQFEEDLAMEAAGAALARPAMRTQLAENAGLPYADLAGMLRAERRIGTWLLRVRARDAGQAEAIATDWLRLTGEEIRALRAHALAADGLSRQLASLEGCLARAANAEPSQGTCALPQDVDLQAEIAALSARLLEEKALSQGVSSGVVFGEIPARVEPARTVAGERGTLGLAGALLGLLAGITTALSTRRRAG